MSPTYSGVVRGSRRCVADFGRGGWGGALFARLELSIYIHKMMAVCA